MTAPEPGTQDLAEWIAEALLDGYAADGGAGCDGGPVPWVEGQPYDMADTLLAGFRAAGLAVVELPEPDEVLPAGQVGTGGESYAWTRAEFGSCVAGLYDKTGGWSVLMDPRLIGANHADDAEVVAGALLAAAAWVRHQGGDPR